jgi:tellurite resistance protein TehA-like permease
MLPDAIKQGAVEPILFWIVEISYQVNYIVFIYKLFKWQSRLHDKLAFPD